MSSNLSPHTLQIGLALHLFDTKVTLIGNDHQDNLNKMSGIIGCNVI